LVLFPLDVTFLPDGRFCSRYTESSRFLADLCWQLCTFADRVHFVEFNLLARYG
jgi:hypothetical protein